jgi:GNAT superfamily N-acetyltransferase
LLGLVATDAEDRPLGLAHLVFHPNTWSVEGVCYLEDLYVDPHARGGRVSQALFEAVFAEARARGVEKTYWHTQQFNGAARSLYDTVGQLTSFVVYESR